MCAMARNQQRGLDCPTLHAVYYRQEVLRVFVKDSLMKLVSCGSSAVRARTACISVLHTFMNVVKQS